MKLFIPELGTNLKLTKNWECPIKREKRNETLIKFTNPQLFTEYNVLKKAYHKIYRNWDITDQERDAAYNKFYSCENNIFTGKISKVIIPKNTILEVDHFDTRVSPTASSSVTFKWRSNGKVIRFRAKFDDVNKIECEDTGKSNKWPNGRFQLISNDSRYCIYFVDSISKKKFGFTYYRTVHSIYDFILRHRRETNIGEIVSCEYPKKYDSKINDYDSLEKMLLGAKRFDYPQDLIDTFVQKFNENNYL